MPPILRSGALLRINKARRSLRMGYLQRYPLPVCPVALLLKEQLGSVQQ